MLGYKPFFKEYTTDWDYAVAKMKGSFFQRHLVEDSYSTARPWVEQVKLSSGDKPTNAEYEQWTLQLHQEEDKAANGLNKIHGVKGVNDLKEVNGFHSKYDI